MIEHPKEAVGPGEVKPGADALPGGLVPPVMWYRKTESRAGEDVGLPKRMATADRVVSEHRG